MPQKFGILGGTFNPVHYGHLAAAQVVQERLNLDQVIFIPSFLPPHKREDEMPSAAQRFDMVRIATAGNARFTVSDIEVKRGGRSYSVDTVRTLKSMQPSADFFFITGLDSFLEIQTWHEWEKLLGLCSFVVLSRPGYRFTDLLKIDFLQNYRSDLETLDRGERSQAILRPGVFSLFLEQIPLYDISSTDIRRRVHAGQPIKYFLPESVEHYIITHKLYA